MQFIYFTLSFLVLSFPLSSILLIYPQSYNPVNELSVERALEITSNHNPELKILKEEMNILRNKITLSGNLGNPSLSYMKEGINGGTFEEERVTLSGSIPLTFLSNPHANSLLYELQAIEFKHDELLARLTIQIKQIYTEIRFAIELEHLVIEELEVANSLLNAVKIKYELGETNMLEFLAAELFYDEVFAHLGETVLLKDRARYKLFSIVGLNPTEQKYSIVFPDSLEYFTVDIPQEEVFVNLENLFEVNSLKANIKSKTVLSEFYLSKYIPNIDFSLYIQNLGTGFNHKGFEIGFSIPILSFANIIPESNNYDIEKKQIQYRIDELILKLKEMAENAWHSYNNAKVFLEKFNSSTAEKANILSELTLNGYRLGELDIFAILSTQRTVISLKRVYLEKLKDYYKSIAELEYFLQRELIFEK